MAFSLTKAGGSSATRQLHCPWRLGTRRGIFSLCLLSFVLLLVVLTVEFGDDDDDDGDANSSRTRVTSSYDDIDDGTRGSGGLDEFWGLGQQGQGRYCRERGQLAVCRPPDAVILAEADLGSRLSSVCSAAALFPASNLTTLALWVADPSMPHIRFSDLFTFGGGDPAAARVEGRAAYGGAAGVGVGESAGGNATGAGTGDSSSSSRGGGGGGGSKSGGVGRSVWVEEGNETAAYWREFLALTHRPVTIRGCQKRRASPDPSAAPAASITLNLYLSPTSINWLVDAVDPCAFERHVSACMALLHPAPAVSKLLLQEDLGRVKSALGLYVDDLSLDGCDGCPISATSSPPLCATRRLAMSFLKRPSLDFALAARTALNAAQISDAFHPARAPLMLKATQLRAATCPKGERAVLGEGGVEEWLKGGEVDGSGSTVGGDGGGLTVGGGVGNGTEAGNGTEVRQLLTRKSLSPDDLMLCVRLQAVELFALSMTRGLISLRGGLASPHAMFIAAQGAARSDLFRVQRPVCDSPPLLPLTKQKLAHFTIIEESLKLVYCAIPKVACNSWLMWLRARLGLPNPEDPLLALNEKKWGLHELALDFTEEEAIRLMTRPDFFKFTFVRNPFSRVASAYSNKLVLTDTPKHKTGTGWGTRQYWSNTFFHHVKPMYEAVKDSQGLVTFPDFVRLVGKLLASHRADMDRHLAPQEDICALGAMKYDFVGRFERMEEDVKVVVDKFGGKHLDVFKFGKGAHFTDTDRRLAKLYDKDTYERVKKIYAMDFYIAMNNITHETPRALYEMYENDF
ncbi:hypothetical protein CLOM_g2938 [Closterium sp. NIES-68]|nr:hypothetical protein CLOM_g2938 [Closterium sp. NIES-68]GJP73420.1 hypothetical protein CLOP_g4135 [Closterium sp. NIES-67]